MFPYVYIFYSHCTIFHYLSKSLKIPQMYSVDEADFLGYHDARQIAITSSPVNYCHECCVLLLLTVVMQQ